MADFTHSLALVIGIDAYDHGIPRLTTAVNDATRLAELLRTEHGYETILLTEPAIGQQVTRERLHTLFTKELKARLGEDDRLLVYFAGHGVALDGDDGPRGYLVPQDARPGDSASMLAMTDLHAWLTALPCRHMLAILDCCFAGAFRWSATRDLGALPDVIHKERYDRYLLSPAWQVLTSAAYDQKALDVLAGDAKRGTLAGGRGQHSPFALALFDALAGAGDVVPTQQGDGVITASELFVYLQDVVSRKAEERANHEQMPGLWPLNKHRKGEFIFLVPGHPLNLPPAPALTDEANPYRGLKSYDQKHAPLFFGREEEIKELAALVDKEPFVAVLGASGTGKSSLVKAGVLPGLQVASGRLQAASDESQSFYHVLPPIRPTDQPVRALETHLKDLRGLQDLGGLAGDEALALTVARWALAHPGQRLVLTIDQFEELATLCRDDDEREHFLRLLATAVRQQADVLRLIITLRTDFEPQFTQKGSPLAEAWGQSRYVVPPMDIEDLRQVIEGPASVRVLYFDPPELVDDLIKEVIQTPGALPLLSFTLSELYVKYVRSGRDDRALTGADYEALGGVVGSLRNRATEEYDALLDDAHRLTMQRVMLRMVAVEGGGELARRRVALSELEYPTQEENARVHAVLDRLVDARLLVRGTTENPDGVKGEAYVEPAHDALVLAWDKLLRWKKEAEEYLPLQRRLAQAAGEWSKAQPEAKSGLLWDDDPRLPQVEETQWPTGGKQKGLRGRIRWARQVLMPKTDALADTKWMNGGELKFVQASVARRTSTFRRIVSITAAVMVSLAGLALLAVFQANQATTERDNAVQAQKTAVAEGNARATEVVVRATAQANADRSAKAEATAAADARQKQLEAEEQRNIATERGRVGRRSIARQMAAEVQNILVQESPDYDLALLLADAAAQATWGDDGHVEDEAARALFEAITQAPPWIMDIPRQPLVGSVSSNSFSPTGERIVTSTKGTTWVWDVAIGKNLLTLPGEQASYSPAGDRIITINGNTVQVHDAATGNVIVALPEQSAPVTSASFDPKDERIVTASESGVQVWDAATGTSLLTLIGQVGDTNLTVATYSPTGDQIVGFAEDGAAQVWNAVTGDALFTLAGHAEGNTKTIYSPTGDHILRAGCDGRLVVGLCSDGSATVWDANTGDDLFTITSGEIRDVAYNPQATRIVTAFDSGEVIVWDARDGNELLRINGHNCIGQFSCAATSASFDPTGTRILTSGLDGHVTIWDSTTGEKVLTEVQAEVMIGYAIYSPAGDRIFSGDENGAVRVLEASSGRELLTLSGYSGSVTSAAFSPNGSRILTAGGETARVWDGVTGEPVLSLSGHIEGITSANYDSISARILTGSSDGTARVWDAATGRSRIVLSGHGEGMSTADFDDTADRIVTVGCEKREDWTGNCELSTVKLWDANTGDLLLTLPEYAGTIEYVSFSPSGDQIVTASDDGVARVWDVTSGSTVVTLTGHEQRVKSANYSHAGALIVTASDDGTARVWDAATGVALGILSGSTEGVNFASFSPADDRVVTAGADGLVGVWDAVTGERLFGFAANSGAITMANYNPAGDRIITTGTSGVVKVWIATPGLIGDPASHKTALMLSGHSKPIHAVALNADEKLLATASGDATAKLWDAATGRELATLFGQSEEILSIEANSAGDRVVTLDSGGTAQLWDVSTGQTFLTVPSSRGLIQSAEFNPDGNRLVTAGCADDNASLDCKPGIVEVWDAASGNLLLTIPVPDRQVTSASYNPAGDRIITAPGCTYRGLFDLKACQEPVQVWEAETGVKLLELNWTQYEVDLAEFSPDGKRIITESCDEIINWEGVGCTNHSVRVWNADDGKLLNQWPPYYDVAIDAIVTDTGVWNAATGTQLLTSGPGGPARYKPSDTATSIDHGTTDERFLLVRDNLVRVINANSGIQEFALYGHGGEVTSASYSPSGKHIVISYSDGTVNVWPATVGELLELARSLIQRNPPLLTQDERLRYGLE